MNVISKASAKETTTYISLAIKQVNFQSLTTITHVLMNPHEHLEYMNM